ncbi:UNVERIFIED_CONTAM: hypothetical protein GTU68_011295 [Idotea baltica]|nr:hypothetical protein [Idotea baltica]
MHADGILLLEEADFIVDTDHIPQDQLTTRLQEYEVIIVRSATKVRKELIDLCPKLKVIARGGVGLDNIDVEYARSKGIVVMNTPAASSDSVAELVFAHMMTLSRSMHMTNRNMPAVGDSEFKSIKKICSKGGELRGLAMGMQVIPVDLRVKRVELKINLYQSDDVNMSITLHTQSFDDMLKQADFITLHVPFSGGKAVIGAEEIAKMKDGVIVVNAARGGAIDEDSLLNGLNSGKIRGAGLDVFSNEPSPRKDILEHPAISLTPHIGGSTVEAQRNIGLELADQIIAHYDK